MGLIKEKDNYAILSDIVGDEDHLGDMDFKVAGTKDGITSLQMDIKISGINYDIMSDALNQAKEGRSHILNEMNKAISAPKEDLHPDIDKIKTINIPTYKIKDVIGKGGKTIKEICDKANVIIDINDNGSVAIISKDNKSNDKAEQLIKDIIIDYKEGDICKGVVIKIIDAGAFVNIPGNKDGFVHISEFADHRVDYVEDIISESDEIYVKVIGVDKRGRPKLSYRAVDQNNGEDISGTIVDKTPDKDSKDNKKKRRFF